jgi:endonuclease/exonuclease/phosphatase family metal-dependent hydrolase
MVYGIRIAQRGRKAKTRRMRAVILALVLVGLAVRAVAAREFTVLVYNVENLFDVDGVAAYEQFRQAPDGDYGVGPLLVKLENIRQTLAAFGESGPEVILFQEFELDRTPFETPRAEDFLRETRGRSLEQLLTRERGFESLPAELLLLKHLDDHGMGGYQIAQPDPFRSESHPAHKNVVFSRFPIEFTRQRPSHDARDLLVVGLNVEGRRLIVLNNHWKSGASSAETEPTRVQNARVVRAELDAILLEDPDADVLIGGDLNCYYNHSASFPRLAVTGINDILGADGNEARMLEEDSRHLYNLWFEVPAAERGSEVWQGYWGTLMQIILTPGLYDREGIQYVDNSFGRLVLAGKNVDSRWGRPLSWTNYGGGSGFSDHLPIYARFRVVETDEAGPMPVDRPTNEAFSAERPRVELERFERRTVPPATVLGALSPAECAERMGELFLVEGTLVGSRPARLRFGDLELEVYSPVRELRDRLGRLQAGQTVRFFADLGDWRGQLQFVIRDPSWWEN